MEVCSLSKLGKERNERKEGMEKESRRRREGGRERGGGGTGENMEGENVTNIYLPHFPPYVLAFLTFFFSFLDVMTALIAPDLS
jgi:hypothetical protein